MARQIVSKEFNVYEVDFPSLSSGSSANGSINIQAEADFLLEKLTYFCDIGTAAQTHSSRVVPLVTVLVTDTGSKRQLMSTAVPVPNIFGSGEIPFILPQPKIFSARSSILVQVANFSSSSNYNLKLSFIGTDVYYSG